MKDQDQQSAQSQEEAFEEWLKWKFCEEGKHLTHDDKFRMWLSWVAALAWSKSSPSPSAESTVTIPCSELARLRTALEAADRLTDELTMTHEGSDHEIILTIMRRLHEANEAYRTARSAMDNKEDGK